MDDFLKLTQGAAAEAENRSAELRQAMDSSWEEAEARERAKRNLNLARTLNPEAEAAAYRKHRESGLPLPLLRAADNAELGKEVDLGRLAPETLRYLGSDVNNAAVSRGDEERINTVVEVAKAGAQPPEERRGSLLSGIRKFGYSPSQLAELKAAGYEPESDGRDGRFRLPSAGGLDAVVTYPVLEQWYLGPGERDRAEEEKAALEKFVKLRREGFDKVRGSAWLVNATGDTVNSYIARLNKEIAVMRELYGAYGDWRELEDAELQTLVDDLGRELGLDVSDISVARLREAGFGGETDWASIFDLFGTVSAYERRTRLTPEELAEVNANPAAYDRADRLELVDYLEDEAKALRGRTVANSIAEGVLGSVKFGSELAATGPVAGLRGVIASKGIFRAIPAVLKRIGVSEAKRLPAYLGEIGLETANEAGPRPVQYIRGGQVLPGMTEAQTGEVASLFFNKVLDRYIENASEQAGVLFPGGRLARAIGRLVPPRAKNLLAIRFLSDLATRSKGALAAGKIMDATAFSGLAGEYFEEKVGDAARWLLSATAELTGVRALEFHQEGIFGSVDDELVLMGTLLATGGVYSSVRLPSLYRDVRTSLRFVDTQTALKERVDASETFRRSPEHVENLIRGAAPEADAAWLNPEDAAAFYQLAPESARKLGLTEDSIAEAEAKGEAIPVSMAAAHSRLERADFDVLVRKLAADPRAMLTAEEAEAIDLSAAAVEAAEQEETRRVELKAAMDNAISQLMRTGRPAAEVRAFSKLLSMANYFGEHSGMSAKEWIENISFRAADDPAARNVVSFDQAAAALRRKGAPNTAERKGQLRDGNVPAVEGFLSENGLSGKGLYADYEFLLGRHPEYFSTPEEVRAAVEFVLDAPEPAGHVLDNLAFVRRDASTGKIYRIEVNPKVVGKRNQIRSVHEITETQYKKNGDRLSRDGEAASPDSVRQGDNAKTSEHPNMKGADLPKIGNLGRASSGLIPDPVRHDTNVKAGGQKERVSDFLRYDTPFSEEIKGESEESGRNFDQSARGMIAFNEDFEAMVTLFPKHADASTLIHELGHYAHQMMKHLVEAGVADARMASDLAKLERWAGPAGTKESAEKIARAFEAYVYEGNPPNAELRGAFRTLLNFLKHVYHSVKELGVELSDEVRSVFDGMLLSEEQAVRESAEADIANALDPNLLGLSAEEKKAFASLSAQAVDQTVGELHELKAKYLSKIRKELRREAKQTMLELPVYQVWSSVKSEGGIDYAALAEMDADIAEELRRKGLTSPKGKSGKNPLSFAAEHGYHSHWNMVQDLFDAEPPAVYLRNVVAALEGRESARFDAGEAAYAAEARIGQLDAVIEKLAEKSGRTGYLAGQRSFKLRARERVNAMSVADIRSDVKLLRDLRNGAKSLTRAAAAKDYNAAFDAAQALRMNMEILRQKREARELIDKTGRLVQRGVRAKKGSIDGDFHHALQLLALHYGFTRRKPTVPGRSPAQLLDDLVSGGALDSDAFEPWISRTELPYSRLTFADFTRLSNLVRYLAGEGRLRVRQEEEAKAAGRRSKREEMLAPLREMPEKYKDPGRGAGRRFNAAALFASLGKINRLTREADNYSSVGKHGRIGPNERYIELALRRADSENITLQEEWSRATDPIMEYFSKRYKEWDLKGLPAFGETAEQYKAYEKWTPEILLGAALHRGNLDSLTKMSEAYGWGGAELENIFSRLSLEDWAMAQKIWDAYDQVLWPKLSRVYKKLNHFNLEKVEPLPFVQNGRQFAGGYFRLRNLEIGETAEHSEARKLESAGIYPTMRSSALATPGSTHARRDSARYLPDLRLTDIDSHASAVIRYVSHREATAEILRIVTTPEYRRAFGSRLGYEKYEALLFMLKHVANPALAEEVAFAKAARYLRGVMSFAYLGFNPSSAAKQLPGLFSGMSRIGISATLAEAPAAFGPEMRALREQSAAMRDRFRAFDRDLRNAKNLLADNPVRKGYRWLQHVGYLAMRSMDYTVSSVVWDAAYRKGIRDGLSHEDAILFADSHVGSTQGSGSELDASPIQLHAAGQFFTAFFSAVSASTNNWALNINALRAGKLSAEDALRFFGADVMAQIVLTAAIAYALSGGWWGDDDDKAKKAFWREVFTGPVQGIPIVRDIGDVAVGFAQGDKLMNSGLRVPVAEFGSDASMKAVKGVGNIVEGESEEGVLKLFDALGDLTGVPGVRVWKRFKRLKAIHFGE